MTDEQFCDLQMSMLQAGQELSKVDQQMVEKMIAKQSDRQNMGRLAEEEMILRPTEPRVVEACRLNVGEVVKIGAGAEKCRVGEKVDSDMESSVAVAVKRRGGKARKVKEQQELRKESELV